MSEENIKVYARVRPCSNPNEDYPGVHVDEIDPRALRFEISNPNSSSPTEHYFSFSNVFWKDSKQEDIFKDVAMSLIDHTLEGYNSTLFAYGQTGSGKTFTITGDGTPQYMGIVPRAIQYTYDKVQQNSNTEISISYLEIYNNTAYDLLTQIGGNQMQKLEDLRKVTLADTGKKIICRDLSIERAQTIEDAHRLFWAGECIRQKAETVNNKYSSRSHTIFTLYFKTFKGDSVVSSKINFVDLAGSEKFASLSNEVNQRKVEAKFINKSLLTLQNVIIGLNQKQKHIPFRDSVLTRFLKDSLIGNVRTSMIATISTNKAHISESIITCRFAESVSTVSTTSKLNQSELPPQELITKLRHEISRLRAELLQLESNPTTYRSTSTIITETEAVELQSKILSFIEDDTDQLEVYGSAQTQFCFQFMKGLILKGNNLALRVSQLQQRLDESQKNVQNLVMLINSRHRNKMNKLISKEAAYIEFYNSHNKFDNVQQIRKSLSENCQKAKTLTDELMELRQKGNALQDERDQINNAISQLKNEINNKTEENEKKQMFDDEVELENAKRKINDEIDEVLQSFEQKVEEVQMRKDEIIELQNQFHQTKKEIQNDFEEFWNNTIIHNLQVLN
ncbi:Kinesin-like protein KIF6 [Histomonas meleagridis]|uniref:Kinesin-like protein KIF6 n=1 Tax=Histomonas meleagridis TaxID=135588 RepID=UPI00355ABC49|nr:Kinesin-like protein KIF6 [Histomonas meleagridis]KAH0803372.1 Kinesin-like protein KIF6 [Histomonas meleagridis]